jgi:hypothetical protein
MLWNEIRNHVLERLPAIVDFFLFAMVITTVTAVLLALTWLYVNCGMALFLLAAVLLWLASLFAAHRAPVHFDGGSPLALGIDNPAQSPPGKQALAPPGCPCRKLKHIANSNILMVEPAQDRRRTHAPCSAHITPNRRVLLQR